MMPTALTVHLPGYITWPADEPVYQGMLTDYGHLLTGTRLAPPPPPQQWRPPAAITPSKPVLQLTAERMS